MNTKGDNKITWSAAVLVSALTATKLHQTQWVCVRIGTEKRTLYFLYIFFAFKPNLGFHPAKSKSLWLLRFNNTSCNIKNQVSRQKEGIFSSCLKAFNHMSVYAMKAI